MTCVCRNVEKVLTVSSKIGFGDWQATCSGGGLGVMKPFTISQKGFLGDQD